MGVWAESFVLILLDAQFKCCSIKFILSGGYIQKVPTLITTIKKFVPRDNDAFATLSDPTGEMEATIHSSVIERHPISIGSVLIMEKISVFTPTRFSHYLNITNDNVIKCISGSSLYPPAFNKVWLIQTKLTILKDILAFNPFQMYVNFQQ